MTLNDHFESMLKATYGNQKLPPEQYRQLKQAFMGGAVSYQLELTKCTDVGVMFENMRTLASEITTYNEELQRQVREMN